MYDWLPKSTNYLERSSRERFDAGAKGFGIRATTEIARGSLIVEYIGEVLTIGDFEERMESIYANEQHHYVLKIDENLVVDAYRYGSLARWVNHACEPNSEVIKLHVKGFPRMVIEAKRNIAAGEEITFNYRFGSFASTSQACLCLGPRCAENWAVAAETNSTAVAPPPMIDESPNNQIDDNETMPGIHIVTLLSPNMERLRHARYDILDTLIMAAHIREKFGIEVGLTLCSLMRGKGKFSISVDYVVKKWFYICPFCGKKFLATKDHSEGFH